MKKKNVTINRRVSCVAFSARTAPHNDRVLADMTLGIRHIHSTHIPSNNGINEIILPVGSLKQPAFFLHLLSTNFHPLEKKREIKYARAALHNL